MIFHGKNKAYKAVFRVTIDRTCAVRVRYPSNIEVILIKKLKVK